MKYKKQREDLCKEIISCLFQYIPVQHEESDNEEYTDSEYDFTDDYLDDYDFKPRRASKLSKKYYNSIPVKKSLMVSYWEKRKYEKRQENRMYHITRHKQNVFKKYGHLIPTKQPWDQVISEEKVCESAPEKYSPPKHNINHDGDMELAIQASLQDVAPCGLSYAAIMELQYRDLTPEDYALLLQLDETVAPKTLGKAKVEKLPTMVFDQQSDDSVCSICMCKYNVGEILRKIPKCGHVFHKECIDYWLTNSSVKCPLDGISLEET